jgi:RluA family pseudouridine synthase
VDTGYEILYEDDHILAVSKSGNIPVHACGVYITHTLIAKLKEDFGPALNLGHRLDRETSGVVVLAKHKEANRELAGMFARGEVDKRYLAVALGHVSEDEFTVDAPIGKIDIRYQYPDEYAHGKENDLATYLPKRVVDPAGKPARTRFEVMRRGALDDGTEYTSLYCYPEEGRTNQIRVHLHHGGHPLVGDKTYALTGAVRDEQIREGITPRVQAALILERHALHCERLAFAHPVTGAPLDIHAPPPGDFNRFFATDGRAAS